MIVPDTIPVERKVLHRGRGPARARAAPPLLAAPPSPPPPPPRPPPPPPAPRVCDVVAAHK